MSTDNAVSDDDRKVLKELKGISEVFDSLPDKQKAGMVAEIRTSFLDYVCNITPEEIRGLRNNTPS